MNVETIKDCGLDSANVSALALLQITRSSSMAFCWRASDGQGSAIARFIGLGGWILRRQVLAPLFLRPRDVRVDAGTIRRVHDPSRVATHGVALWSAGQSKFRSARVVIALLVPHGREAPDRVPAQGGLGRGRSGARDVGDVAVRDITDFKGRPLRRPFRLRPPCLLRSPPSCGAPMTTVAVIVLVAVLLAVTVVVTAGCAWAALYYGFGDDDDD